MVQPSSDSSVVDSPEGSSSEPNTRSVLSKVDIKSTCIFCEEGEHKQKLVSASTLGIGPNIYACAAALKDNKLLTKLYSTDLVALEAKYHKHCYVHFLNKVRSSNRLQPNVEDNSSRTAYGSVLCELVVYIQDM